MSVMKTSEAMRLIARAYHKPWRERDDRERYITKDGICFAVDNLFVSMDISNDTHYDLEAILGRDVDLFEDRTPYCYFLPCRMYNQKRFRRKHDFLRGDYCTLLAEQFKEEGL